MKLVAALCHLVTNRLLELGQPMRGISLHLRAIQKIQLHSTQLTSVHADLCQLCLLAKCFKPALPILDNDITAINQEVRLQFYLFILIPWVKEGFMIFVNIFFKKFWKMAI